MHTLKEKYKIQFFEAFDYIDSNSNSGKNKILNTLFTSAQCVLDNHIKTTTWIRYSGFSP